VIIIHHSPNQLVTYLVRSITALTPFSNALMFIAPFPHFSFFIPLSIHGYNILLISCSFLKSLGSLLPLPFGTFSKSSLSNAFTFNLTQRDHLAIQHNKMHPLKDFDNLANAYLRTTLQACQEQWPWKFKGHWKLSKGWTVKNRYPTLQLMGPRA
jgi:hypothetical protein